MRLVKQLLPYLPAVRFMEAFHEEKHTVILDSSLENGLGRYTILGRNPYLTLIKGETFTANGEPQDIPFEAYVKDYLLNHREENPTELPIVSGAIGYFSYDYGREKEGIQAKDEKTLDIPDVILNFYDEFIVEDLEKHEVWLAANGKLRDPGEAVRELEETAGRLRSAGAAETAETAEGCETEQPRAAQDREPKSSGSVDGREVEIRANFVKEDYLDAIDHMIRYITEGDIYVVNMTQQLELRGRGTPYELFCRLRRSNPSPFGGFLQYGDMQIVCASPERFLQMKDRHIETRPIKGTRKRGSTPEEDAALKEELAGSEKDQSELLMIVDLERNDLNRVCVPGSVRVTELFSVETYATVFHLVSNVVGELREGLTVMDLMEAAFPGGSITGAPKIRAMELIDEQEHGRRNLYTGSIGYLTLDGSCDFNIVIRTAVCRDGVYHLGVGGGITYESDLEFEYEETYQKAKALIEALKSCSGGQEESYGRKD